MPIMEKQSEHLFQPPPSEQKKPTFVRELQTSTILYSSIPTQNPRGEEASFLANVDPGLELKIEDRSWQQFCKEKDTKKDPNDVWVRAEVATLNSPYEGMPVYVTMGDLTRLPENKKKKNQPKQEKLTSKPKINNALDLETKTAKEEDKYFIQRVQTPVKKLLYERRGKNKGEWGQTKTYGEIKVRVEGDWEEIWKDKKSHYLEGIVVYVTDPEDAFLFESRVVISKGEASRKPKDYKGPKHPNKSTDDIPF